MNTLRARFTGHTTAEWKLLGVFLIVAVVTSMHGPGTIRIGQGDGTSIVDTTHNLSSSGPGVYKATMESRICIFCHTPHRARSTAPLWNRLDSTATYMNYTSTSYGGASSPPSGSSKLCLSCHDGSIALGSVYSLPTEIQMEPGRQFLDSGPAHIGTNLADDHPISFDYSASKGGSGFEYKSSASITPPVHLDPAGLVQCTSCHDPHNNSLGSFLLASDRYALLCQACHIPNGWANSSHNLSAATWNGADTNPWPTAKYATVAENACANCHEAHGSLHSERLLTFDLEEDNCLHCHNGNVAAKDIERDLARPSRHTPFLTSGTHDPTEDFLSMPRHAECQDCHDPHSSRAGQAAPPGVPGPLTGISGLSSSGQPVREISFGYELCYKCHADNHGSPTYVPRIIQQANTRLEFNPANPSFHPVEAPGANNSVPSLLPPWTTASIVACTDCHQSDTSPAAGGTGPAGPHGSNYRPLLIANYSTTDNTQESPQAYALCYRCHNRTSILNSESFPEHDEHLKQDIPCSACHDAHGISASQGNSGNASHLINFDSRLVKPSPTTGQLWFRDDGFRQGACSLLCHGEDHGPEDYR